MDIGPNLMRVILALIAAAGVGLAGWFSYLVIKERNGKNGNK